MDELGKPRIKVPPLVKAGEVFEVKTIVAHPMETGQRKDAAGQPIPRRIINRFTCRFNGREVCAMEFGPGVAANPYVAFFLRVEEAGELRFEWRDDDGSIYSTSQRIELAG